MKTFEIKGFWGFVLFGVISLVLLCIATALPVSFSLVAWNAIVGEVFHGPMIGITEALVLTAIFAVIFKIVFQPQISFQVKRVKSSDEKNKALRNLKEQDSTKD